MRAHADALCPCSGVLLSSWRVDPFRAWSAERETLARPGTSSHYPGPRSEPMRCTAATARTRRAGGLTQGPVPMGEHSRLHLLAPNPNRLRPGVCRINASSATAALRNKDTPASPRACGHFACPGICAARTSLAPGVLIDPWSWPVRAFSASFDLSDCWPTGRRGVLASSQLPLRPPHTYPDVSGLSSSFTETVYEYPWPCAGRDTDRVPNRRVSGSRSRLYSP